VVDLGSHEADDSVSQAEQKWKGGARKEAKVCAGEEERGMLKE
jgi:hypothetical protein